MANFKINLQPNEEGKYIYWAGEVLRGAITLKLTQPRKLYAIHVQLYGAAKTNYKDFSNNQNASGEEILLNSKICLFGGDSDGTDIEFLPNEYEYKFQYKLPVNLPHSLRDFYGTISYEVRCIISSNSEAFKDGTKYFTVVRDDDLSLYPELKDPVEAKDRSSALCGTDDLLMKVTLPHSAFNVGGRIPVSINFIGSGNINIQYIRFVLKRIMIFNSVKGQSKVKIDVIFKSYLKEYGGHDTLEVHYNLEVPKPLILSNNRFTKLIQVKYSLEVKAKNGGCFGQPTKVSLPVIIGTRSFTCEPIPLTQLETPGDDLPPSFEEAVGLSSAKPLMSKKTAHSQGSAPVASDTFVATSTLANTALDDDCADVCFMCCCACFVCADCND